MSLKINELFYSIQGEGLTIGQPAIFVRLSGCNLSCWFCDTKYHNKVNSHLTEQSILNLLKENPNCNRLIFTGGEPFLQQDEICEFLIKNWIFLQDIKIEFETNGSVIFKHNIRLLMKKKLFNFHFNVSPKLFSSGNAHNGVCYYQFKDIKAPNTIIFKFVYISNHFFEILNYIIDVGISKEKVYVMPEGATKEEQELMMEEVVEFCKKYGFNFSPRLQVLLWNKKRGV